MAIDPKKKKKPGALGAFKEPKKVTPAIKTPTRTPSANPLAKNQFLTGGKSTKEILAGRGFARPEAPEIKSTPSEETDLAKFFQPKFVFNDDKTVTMTQGDQTRVLTAQEYKGFLGESHAGAPTQNLTEAQNIRDISAVAQGIGRDQDAAKQRAGIISRQQGITYAEALESLSTLAPELPAAEGRPLSAIRTLQTLGKGIGAGKLLGGSGNSGATTIGSVTYFGVDAAAAQGMTDQDAASRIVSESMGVLDTLAENVNQGMSPNEAAMAVKQIELNIRVAESVFKRDSQTLIGAELTNAVANLASADIILNERMQPYKDRITRAILFPPSDIVTGRRQQQEEQGLE